MKLEDLFKGFKNGGSTKLPVLIILIAAAAAFYLLTGSFGLGQTTAQGDSVKQLEQQRELQALEQEYESKLAGTLERIDGVGNVKVAVTLNTGPRAQFGVNETHAQTEQQEIPAQGQKRTVKQTNDTTQMVLAGQSGSSSQPVKIVELRPEISGVLVVAEGAKNPYVLERIRKSVETLLNIPASKIRVEPMVKEVK